jgi:hypothetical protein
MAKNDDKKDDRLEEAKTDTNDDKNVTAEQQREGVTQHLDRDPNDPRNVEPAKPGVSLNDMGGGNFAGDDEEKAKQEADKRP